MNKPKKPVRKPWSADRLLGISAVLVSLMTLTVLAYQTRLMREQQRMSVLPYITVMNHGSGSRFYKLVLTNDGIGPAFIDSVYVKEKDSVYPLDLPQYLYARHRAIDSVQGLLTSNIYAGRVVPAQKEIALLELTGDSLAPYLLMDILSKIRGEGTTIGLFYQSSFGERWHLEYGAPAPVKVD